MLNSWSMVLLKFSSPGVPDLYQGNELIDLSLVDPDNRRPVDYELRARLLDEMETLASRPAFATSVNALAREPHDGRAKLWLTWRLLALRQRLPELFRDGRYLPLGVAGGHQEHAVAYARQHGEHLVVVVAGRLFARLMPEPGSLPLGTAVWDDTAVEVADGLSLPDGQRLLNVLTGETVVVEGGRVVLAAAFQHFPGAVLVPAG